MPLKRVVYDLTVIYEHEEQNRLGGRGPPSPGPAQWSVQAQAGRREGLLPRVYEAIHTGE